MYIYVFIGWGMYGTGLRDLLIYTADRYNNLPTYITENGLAWEARWRIRAK